MGDNLTAMQVDTSLVTWKANYLIGRSQYVCLHLCVLDSMVSNNGALQETVLFLFTLYTMGLNYRSETAHLQMFSDDSADVSEERDEEGGGNMSKSLRW